MSTHASLASLPGPDDVHRFWFGDVRDWADCVRANHPRWFRHGRDLDRPVRETFAPLVKAAGQGACESWLDAPRGALALILTLDQFPRHLHRGSGRAFDLDPRARTACEVGMERGHDRVLSPVERSFFYLPLEHAEDAAAQARCVSLMERAAQACDPRLSEFMADVVRHARLHREIIARFGRFPHRNDALGRALTDAERAWLAEGGTRFGQ